MIPFAMGLDAAIAFLKRWRLLLALIPLIAIGIQTLRLNSARADLLEKQAIISNMKLASEKARAAQVALNQANQDLSQRIADDARISHAENRAAVAGAIADFATSHGLRQACSNIAGRSDPPAVPGDPGAPDRTDGSEVLAVPRSDFEALSKDALRGAEARAFLIDLANEGLAVINPVPAPSQP